MKFNLFNRKPAMVSITGITLYWKGAIHTLKGLESKTREFELEIPFKNKKIENLSFLKSEEQKPETIYGIELGKPFKLLGSEPATPFSVNVEESKTIKLKIEGPEFGYSGPLTVKLIGKAEERIHVELPEIFLSRGNKRVKVNEHGEVYNLLKNQVFEVSAQMYKILTFNDTVDDIRISAPFEFEGSDPKLPFRIDDKSSYVVSFMIKAPDFDYSGPLEIYI